MPDTYKQGLPGEFSSAESISGVVSEASDLVTTAISGVPAPIRKSAIKAFAQLCTAVMDLPIAHFEGLAAEKRAETQARLRLIQESSGKISTQLSVSEEYVNAASHKFAAKIVREQSNLDKISKIALDDISCVEVQGFSGVDVDEVKLISDDWLNNFEREASTKSSEEMQLLFGKILAGEIRRPSSFSLKTVRLLSQLDEEAAEAFSRFCAMCVALLVEDVPCDARVITIGEDKTGNPLVEYDFSFSDILLLQEHGLLMSELETSVDYITTVVGADEDLFFIRFAGEKWCLERDGKVPDLSELRLGGASLTTAGRELFQIVEIVNNEKYNAALPAYLSHFGVKMVRVGE